MRRQEELGKPTHGKPKMLVHTQAGHSCWEKGHTAIGSPKSKEKGSRSFGPKREHDTTESLSPEKEKKAKESFGPKVGDRYYQTVRHVLTGSHACQDGCIGMLSS
jgi:hypothetical protein